MEIKYVLTDCDGVLTDNRVLYVDGSTPARFFNMSDGHGVQLLQEAGIQCYILSGEDDNTIWHRAKKLSMDFHATQDKLQTALYLGFDLKRCAFMGNDLPDFDLLREVALPACPADAVDVVLDYCFKNGFVSRFNGGNAAFRELADYLLISRIN